MVSPSGSHRADRVVRLPECGWEAPRRGVHPDESHDFFLGLAMSRKTHFFRENSRVSATSLEKMHACVHFYSANL
jgi:hypothetical protein